MWTGSTKKYPPNEVVRLYTHHTLGTLINANIDYDAARKYLTPELKAQFTDNLFILRSYCIQDGPTNVQMIKEESTASSASVVVSAFYDTEWQKMWKFSLVRNEGETGGYWRIKEITCLDPV